MTEERNLDILSKKEALRRVQEIVARYAQNCSLASELISERRQEAEEENK
ncbi:hypothetical protein [Cyanothece sp. BG0011]|nr:hypothetical protein [Cyanothece sp. BG0011]